MFPKANMNIIGTPISTSGEDMGKIMFEFTAVNKVGI